MTTVEKPVDPNKGKGNTSALALPFPIASRAMKRFSFNDQRALGTGITAVTPIQIPAVGYMRSLQLKFTFAGTAGTSFGADGPFNLISSIEFRTAAGNDLIVPMTGYQLYLINKFGHPSVMSPYSDPKYVSYSTTAGTAATFFLDIPLELDPETGWGSIPALASNRSYQLVINYAPYTVVTGATAGNMTVEGVANYWSEPPAQSASGLSQETQPQGLGTISQWQLDTPPVGPGDRYVKLNNVGNFMRNIIFVLRNAAGARISADWPASAEIYLDNEPMFYLPAADWQRFMRQNFGLVAAAPDVANGLDTGVYVLPFDSLVGSLSGDPANSRSQYLPTLDSSQLVIRGTSFGANAAIMEVLTNSVIPKNSADVYSK